MLSQEYIKSVLHYEPGTGIFTWLPRGDAKWDNRFAGRVAGSVNNKGYVVITLLKKPRLAHRLAYLYMTGKQAPKMLDHNLCNKMDNRWDEIRLASSSQNHHNTPTPVTNTSGAKGVHYDKHRKKWRGSVCLNGKVHYTARFDTRDEVVPHVMALREKLHGAFTNHG